MISNSHPNNHNNIKLPGFTVIIPAAGSSSRMGGVDKLQVEIDGKPVIVRTLEVFDTCETCEEIILVSSPSNIDNFHKLIDRYQVRKVSRIIEGGKQRQDSVYNGLKHVRTDYVAVHDGARPLLTLALLTKLHRNSLEHGSCIPVLPVKDTIKIIDENNYVQSTPERKKLYLVQTPQFFPTRTLMDSYEKISELSVQATDDSSIVELAGHKVKVVPGEPENIKITSMEDVAVAITFLRRAATLDTELQ
jgi:2-C-methyl-D-erythritol 4-phosphate cytidylyltransferase